jgi:hypothetical protein
MCFYAYIRYVCADCDATLEETTIKKRDCRKRSCDKTVKPGTPIKEKKIRRRDPNCECQVPLWYD